MRKVCIPAQHSYGGSDRFFYLSFRDSNLKHYYENMFTLTHQYKYTLSELENMIPWERDVYIGMVNGWVKEETERVKQRKADAQREQEQMMKMLNKPQKQPRPRRR